MKLRECPFCGGKAHKRINLKTKLRAVGCSGCYATTGNYKTEQEAVDAWNIRFGDDLMERMEDDGK